MASIDSIRELFSKPKGDEDKLLRILQKFLEKIDKQKHGTFIGKKRKINYEELMKKATFSTEMSSEDEVIERIVGLYDGVPLWGECVNGLTWHMNANCGAV